MAGQVPGLLARARAAGVTHLVCCATREADWDAVLDLAREHACILPMLGLHPWHAGAAAPGWCARLEARARTVRCGIGECGLDFAPGRPARALQEAAFGAQVRLAIALDRPLSIHCVRAWGRLAALLGDSGIPAAGAAVHAFSGSAEVARELQAMGLDLGFGPALIRPGSRTARALAALDPAHLLFETDAPGAGEREPAQVAEVGRNVARLRGAGPELAAQVQANARRLFQGLLP